MAVYRPIGFSPSIGETRNMLVAQTFTAIASSKITHYQLKIYNNSTGNILYNSSKIALSTVLYYGEVLEHTVPITAGMASIRELKWTLQVWNELETLDSLQLKEIYFKNYTPPTISLTFPSVITSQSYNFSGTYSQTQGVDVQKYKYTLYTANEKFILSSDWIYNGSLKYTVSGFVDSTAYKILLEVYDLNNVYTATEKILFSVDYASPTVSFQPTITNLPNESAIELELTGVYSIEGESTGTINYESLGSDIHLAMNSSSAVSWENINIQETFTMTFKWLYPSNSFSGKIFKLNNTLSGGNHYYEVGYLDGKFYYNISGVTQYSSTISLNSDYVYVIIITQLGMKIFRLIEGEGL